MRGLISHPRLKCATRVKDYSTLRLSPHNAYISILPELGKHWDNREEGIIHRKRNLQDKTGVKLRAHLQQSVLIFAKQQLVITWKNRSARPLIIVLSAVCCSSSTANQYYAVAECTITSLLFVLILLLMHLTVNCVRY